MKKFKTFIQIGALFAMGSGFVFADLVFPAFLCFFTAGWKLYPIAVGTKS